MARYLKYDNINFDELIFTRDGNDLVVSSKKLKKPDRVENYFTDEKPLNLVKTADRFIAHSLRDEMVLSLSSTQNQDGSYSVEGSAHDNIIYGSKNDDIITGALGNDIITGGKGSDTFIFNLGDGQDIIKDAQNNDVIHINAGLSDLKYSRVNNDLQIYYSDEDSITLTNFFKNKSSKNVDLIKNLDGDIQKEYEDYINNPPYSIVYYHGMPEKVYYAKIFMSQDGYELEEKSILKNAKIEIGEKSTFTGTDYNENVTVIGKNGKFSLGSGNDTLTYSDDFGQSVVTLNKNENLNLKFNSDIELDYKISGNDLVLTTTDNNTVTLKNFLRRVNDATVQINGKSITSIAGYLEMLKADASDFKKGKYIGTTLNDDIDASDYKSRSKIGVSVNSKSGSDKVTGSDYNDTIKVKSIDGDRTTVIENGGVNNITTGAGRDTISVYGNSSNTIVAGEGKNVITLSSTGKNKYTGGNGIERIYVTNGENNINMKNGYNTINISAGKNTVTGGKDYDVVYVSGGENKISTGAGFDKISIIDGTNTINAGAGNDTIELSGGNAVLDGGEGDDLFDFMDYYNSSQKSFDGHVDIIDTKGKNELYFSDQMVFEEEPVKTEDGGYYQLSRLDGRPFVFFDVSINKKGQTVVGKDVLFTAAKSFTGFNDNGIHVSDMGTISKISAIHFEALYYMGMYSEYGKDMLDPEEPYYRPNYGKFASSKYTFDVTELAEKVSGWLSSDSNTSGYKSAMDVFTKGTESEISELTALYVNNATNCYQTIK